MLCSCKLICNENNLYEEIYISWGGWCILLALTVDGITLLLAPALAKSLVLKILAWKACGLLRPG